jgi:hypothetical protein
MSLKVASQTKQDEVKAWMEGRGPIPSGVIITSRPPHAYVRAGKTDDILGAAADLAERDIQEAKERGDAPPPPGSTADR